MFNVGTQELLVILLVVLLLFGAKRIPEVARALGKGVGDFREALSGLERELTGEPPARRPPRRLTPPGQGSAESVEPTVPRSRPAATAHSAPSPDLTTSGESNETSGTPRNPSPAADESAPEREA